MCGKYFEVNWILSAGGNVISKEDSSYSILCHYQFHFLKFTPSHLLPLLPLPNNNKKKEERKRKHFKYIWGKHCFEIIQESFRKPPIWKSSPILGAKWRGADTLTVSAVSPYPQPQAPRSWGREFIGSALPAPWVSFPHMGSPLFLWKFGFLLKSFTMRHWYWRLVRLIALFLHVFAF